MVLSYNLRGCGSSVKRKCLWDLISSVATDISFIQESKLFGFKAVSADSIWPNNSMEWCAK